MKLTNNQKEHLKVINDVLKYIPNNYVLKCGTALLLDYDLDRFGEDIDLDYLITNTKFNNLKKALKNV
ncbi:nucleotidyl transferase AbiEii/AbiGii toxin family protein [Mycoplasmopsis iners]|uniref:nucleotidyl transferase AbiEii/AbiGii toxin family protein n=1 Tax=Mycoplasmopsis iners TaxID=76630 RepID=UPI000496D26D|nr:nucleotidyl transferase AbiEii/AbiGii toxin family protein [Mycoplasmopsis iners]